MGGGGEGGGAKGGGGCPGGGVSGRGGGGVSRGGVCPEEWPTLTLSPSLPIRVENSVRPG